MWFHFTRDGRPIRKRRYAFSESFAAIAYGEFAQATGKSEYAQQAKNCFSRFVDHNLNPVGTEPKFTDVRPSQGIGFPMISIATAQQLRGSIDLENADALIDRSVELIRTTFMKADIRCVMETVGPAGEMIDHFDHTNSNIL